MTSWNKKGQPLYVDTKHMKLLTKFIEKIERDEDTPLWKIHGDSIWPRSDEMLIPEDYVAPLLQIVDWIKKKGYEPQGAYSYTFVDSQNPYTSVGGININEKSIKFVSLDQDGIVVESEY